MNTLVQQFNQNHGMMGPMDDLKLTFENPPAQMKADNTLSALMAWYEGGANQKPNTVPSISMSFDLPPIDINPFDHVRNGDADSSPIDLAPLPLVSEMNQNHCSKDNAVLNSIDDVLNIFGNDNSNSEDDDISCIDFFGDLEPTPISADCVPSASSAIKRSLDLQQDSAPASKKQRTSTMVEECNEGFNFFRPYQAEQWTQRYDELCEYVKTHGNCQVPHSYTQNPALSRWVKRQRYQYKLRVENKTSTMTEERVAALERIGFVWDSHVAAWDERRSELIEYKRTYGHCNVPSNYPSNRQLAVWVKRQRRQYKFFLAGKPSSMTDDRIASLESIGFEWELRSRGAKKN
jgi:hypothetical protein